MFIAIFAFALVAGHVAAELPTYIHVCNRNDPNLDRCIVNSVNVIKPKLCEGIPELSVPPFDPVIIDRISLSDTPNSKIHLTDLTINGLCDFNVTNFHMNPENLHCDIDVSFRRILINSTYDLDLHILVPISQTGKVSIISDNVNAKAKAELKITNRHGKRYVYLSRLKLNLDIKGYNAHYDLSENELSQLSKLASSFIGNNQREIIAVVKPPIEEVTSKRILMLSNEIVKHFTYEELFPESA